MYRWHGIKLRRIDISNPCSYFCIERDVELWLRELVELLMFHS